MKLNRKDNEIKKNHAGVTRQSNLVKLQYSNNLIISLDKIIDEINLKVFLKNKASNDMYAIQTKETRTAAVVKIVGKKYTRII